MWRAQKGNKCHKTQNNDNKTDNNKGTKRDTENDQNTNKRVKLNSALVSEVLNQDE